MQNNTVLITNNEELSRIVRNGRFVEGSSLDVLVSVRSSVHLGGRLLTHPLCGNLRPYQQPFRSVPFGPASVPHLADYEIGRASCRERV